MSKLEELAILVGLTVSGLILQLGSGDSYKAERIAADIISSCRDVQEMREKIESASDI